MRVESFEKDGARILECVEPIARAAEALDLVSTCFEQRSQRVLIESRNLPAEFFDLRSGFAGEFVQKLVNYSIRLAAVFPSEAGYGQRFREFLLEAKRGRDFRAFSDRAGAEAWLASP